MTPTRKISFSETLKAGLMTPGGKRKRKTSPQSPEEGTPVKLANPSALPGVSPIPETSPNTRQTMQFIEDMHISTVQVSLTTKVRKQPALIYFTIALIEKACTLTLGDQIHKASVKVLHPDNIINVWDPRRSLGPTFLIK